MKIISQRPGFVESDWRKPSAEEAERQLRDHREEYIGFVDGLPEVRFAAALEAATRFYPPCLSAEQIVGICVVLQYQDDPPRPVWDIHVYGAPNIRSKDPVRPFYLTDHSRILVDAATGKVLWQDNRPHPER